MPITQRAIKKMHHDQKKEAANAIMRRRLRDAVRSARKNPTKKTVTATYRILDKAAKTHIIHKNKSARLKSRLARLLIKKKK